MCNNAPGWLHSKRLNVWRPARRRRETPWRLSTFQTVARWRPTSAARRIGPQFVLARASRMRCSSTSLSAHGHERGTGRRGAHHAPLARSASPAASQRSRVVVTVVGEHPIERAPWRAPSRRRERAPPSHASRAVRTCIYRLSCPALPRSLQSWRPKASVEGRTFLLSRPSGPWAAQLGDQSVAGGCRGLGDLYPRALARQQALAGLMIEEV